MVINDRLKKQLKELEKNIDVITYSNNIIGLQLENFLKNFEKARYGLLEEIKKQNNLVEYEYEKIKTIDEDYHAEFNNGILKIYIPEVMPSYKNIKTHAHKRILLNVKEISKDYAGIFSNEVFIFIKIFDNILGWDIDNKYIKPISDGLIYSGVIKDDNISKMFYCAKGEYSENPHTEVYVLEGKNVSEFLEKYSA